MKTYFSYSSKEFRGILIMLMMLIALLVVRMYVLYHPAKSDFDVGDMERAYLQMQKYSDSLASIADNKMRSAVVEKLVITPVKFNPNTVTSEQWQAMGLPPWLFENMQRYLLAGGEFRKSNDLARLYGMKPQWFQKLEPFIMLPQPVVEENAFVWKDKKETLIVELNSADSAMLTAVKGIGPWTARRIIQYRNALGGFISLQQLSAVKGMDSARMVGILPQLSLNKADVQRIDINQAPLAQLSRHPYLNFYIARKIIDYRIRNAPFQSVEQLLYDSVIDSVIYYKVAPYLQVSPNE